MNKSGVHRLTRCPARIGKTASAALIVLEATSDPTTSGLISLSRCKLRQVLDRPATIYAKVKNARSVHAAIKLRCYRDWNPTVALKIKRTGFVGSRCVTGSWEFDDPTLFRTGYLKNAG